MPKNVLIVDDEKEFLQSLTKGLSAYDSQFKVVTASDGRKAVEVLNSQTVDLVVTDLKMPGMDGFELMAHMSDKFPLMPVIVMSAFASSAIEEKIKLAGGLKLLEKPLEFDELINAITSTLSSEKEEGNVSGFGMDGFLQLIEMEKKSCVLVISSAGQERGYFIFKDGDLLDAFCNKRVGAEAAIEILGLKDVLMKIRKLPRRKLTQRIKNGVIPILMEHARREDENAKTEDDPALKCDSGEVEPARHDGDDIEPGVVAGQKKAIKKEVQEAQATKAVQPRKDQTILTQEVNTMALETLLQELKGIAGLKAVGVMSYTGEMLASESVDPGTSLDLVGATFNDIFRQSHEACGKIGLQACEENIINTPDGIIIMICSGVESAVHLHLVAILAADGNQALFKMQAKKLLPKFVEELT